MISRILLQYFEDKDKTDWMGYALASLFLLAGIISSLTENLCFFQTAVIGFRIEAVLIGLVYRKVWKFDYLNK